MPEVVASFSRPRAIFEKLLKDRDFYAGYALWLHENFDSLVDEFQKHGRFLTLKEIEDSPLEFSDRP